MSAVTKSPSPSIKSVTIIRQDVIPAAGPGVQSSLRLARFAQSVALLVTPQPDPDKFFADVTSSQTHDFEWAVTQNPIESGSTINDHVRKMPDKLQVTGFITDTPLFPPTPIFANRAQSEFQKLLSFANEREPVFVATSVRVYSDMIITRLSVSRDQNTGGAIPVSISLQEIQISSASTTKRLVDELAAAVGATPPVNGGTQALITGGVLI